MTIHNPADIRNVVLTGHSGSGKTTLTERLLFAAGVTKRMGSVEEGNTVSDYTKEEIHHKHSVYASIVQFTHHNHVVNVVDTPGLTDFFGQAVASFPAGETIAIVVDAVKGIESTTRRLMAIAAERHIPRIIVINKIDSHEAELEPLVEQLRETFGQICLPINLPCKGGTDVINVFDHDGSDSAGDAADFSSVSDAHKAIIEQIVEVEERLMETYLEKGDSFDPKDLHAAFEKCLEEAHLVPICFVSAKSGAGIEDLLHVFADLCPSPQEVHPPEFLYRPIDPAGQPGDEQTFLPNPDPSGKVIAHVFKVSTDPYVGKLAVFRVHSGTLKAKGELLLNDQKRAIRIGHVYRVRGKETVETDSIGPGDIGAVAKIDDVHFNAVLHDSHEHDSVHLDPLPLPRPMLGLAVELKNHADETKFANACHKLMEEDPCFVVERIAATKQTVLRGLGELHLRVILERLKELGIELNTSKPKVAYKETITTRADGHHRHKKQTGGAGQFGEVYLRVEPLPNDHPEGFEFASEVVGGTVPRQYWPAVEKGCRMIMADGAIAGYPLTGVRVILYDGKYHDVDSKEIAFVTAGKKAFIDAIQKARPVLMEPFVKLEITLPSKHMGDLTGLLSGKRGRVLDTDIAPSGDSAVIRAEAPLSEVQNFSNELKSMTGGQGAYTMEYSHDERTPAHIQQEVVAAFKPRHDEE
jgi:elongation factor G